jgi:hypothetical protein
MKRRLKNPAKEILVIAESESSCEKQVGNKEGIRIKYCT